MLKHLAAFEAKNFVPNAVQHLKRKAMDALVNQFLPGPSAKRRCLSGKPELMSDAAFVMLKKTQNCDLFNHWMYRCETCGEENVEGKSCEFFWGELKQGWWTYCDDCMSDWRRERKQESLESRRYW